MRGIRHDITVSSRAEEVHIFVLSDVHIGHSACDEHLLGSWVNKIKETENGYWIGLGDMADCISRIDPRYREESIAPWLRGVSAIVSEQRKRLLDVLSPIADRCLAYLKGNHEYTMERAGIDVYLSVAENLSGPNGKQSVALGVSGFIRLGIRREHAGGYSTKDVIFYAHHGHGGGQLAGSKALRLERLPSSYSADVYLLGHNHARMVMQKEVWTVNARGRIIIKPVVLAHCGTFLRSIVPDSHIDTYADVKGYQPAPLGGVEIVIYPGRIDAGRGDWISVIF